MRCCRRCCPSSPTSRCTAGSTTSPRASAVLGIVGAGGIGFELMAALRLIAYDQVAAILLTILACVVVVDGLGCNAAAQAQVNRRPIVVASNRLHPQVVQRLTAVAELRAPLGDAPYDATSLALHLRDADAFMGFMTDRVDAAWLAGAPRLRIVGAALKGYDNYDPAACAAAGVWLTIVPELLTEPTAELAIGLAIGLGRHVLAGDRHVRSGQFDGWRPTHYGIGLAGSTVAVIGLGKVGRAIIDRLAGFGVRALLGVDPQARDARAQPVDLASAMRHADVVFVAAPLVPGTRHLVGRAALADAAPGLLIVNVGRGSVVDEAAIADALDAGRLGGYAADVSNAKTGRSTTGLARYRRGSPGMLPRCSPRTSDRPWRGCGWRSSSAPPTTSWRCSPAARRRIR